MSTKKIKKSELKRLVREQLEQKDLNEFFGKFGKKKWEKEGSAGLEDTVAMMRKNIEQALNHLTKLRKELSSPTSNQREYGDRWFDEPPPKDQMKTNPDQKQSGLDWNKEEKGWDVKKKVELAIMSLQRALGKVGGEGEDVSRVKNVVPATTQSKQKSYRELSESQTEIMKEVIEEMKKQ